MSAERPPNRAQTGEPRHDVYKDPAEKRVDPYPDPDAARRKRAASELGRLTTSRTVQAADRTTPADSRDQAAPDLGRLATARTVLLPERTPPARDAPREQRSREDDVAREDRDR